jgi:hypothetical protein
MLLIFVQAGAVYPLNSRTRGRDVGMYGNPSGIVSSVRYIKGPEGARHSATQFFGRSNSFIEFRNRGRLDTKYSITMLAWINHKGRAGPIFNYNPRGWGVHFWMITPRTLFVRFVRRNRRFTKALTVNIRPNTWQYVGATYNGKTGIAKLFVNNRFVVRRRLGRFTLATNYPARMGARIGDSRYFKGGISCMQIFDKALSRYQIVKLRKRCFIKGW